MASFVDQDGQTIETEFEYVRGEIDLFQCRPDVFYDSDGSAQEIRAVMGLATRFMLVAQGEDVDT